MPQKIETVNAALGAKQSAANMASEVQRRIEVENGLGWECVGVSNVQATVAGSAGCFGIGATMPYTHSVVILLFRKP